MSLIQACCSLALSTWLLSFCFVHLLCLDFTVAEKEEWYTAFVNITYIDPATSEVRTEKTECGRYGEHSLKRDAKGVVVLPSLSPDRQACDPNTRFIVPVQGSAWIALIARGNCTFKDKIKHAASQNASAIVIFNVGSSNANDTITMPYSEFSLADTEQWYMAFVNITYRDPTTSEVRTEKTECGRYGEHSWTRDAKGVVVLPSLSPDRQACDPNTRFIVPVQGSAWIALIARGNCTFKDKIKHAASQNASAIVIFNVGSSNANHTITMPYSGIGDVIAIMIPEPKGREVVALLERNITVTMHITLGTRNLQKYVSRTSVVFVSISFIVLMIISLAWLVFYYIQRFRYANARDRNQRRLGDAAKKAISKLQVRTIRRGDQETESDFDNCAVCIEGYKPNDTVRILPCRHLFHKSCVDPWLLDHRTCPMCKMNILKALGIALNADCLDELPLDYELMGDGGVGGLPLDAVVSGGSSDGTLSEGGSVVLDPGVRRVGLPQDYNDTDPLRESPVTATTDTDTGEFQPIASSAWHPW
ncbi:hypothetical protein UPYG_G00244390 [Umbra pygmaea]|uniref:RING-type domain-containing protein n=1 Tax=Umbra pygmaea TaxID=75934 RepID=A0ABD0WG19_UMBPY